MHQKYAPGRISSLLGQFLALTIAITASPQHAHIPGNVTDPYILLTATEPHPIKFTKYVPIASAITLI